MIRPHNRPAAAHLQNARTGEHGRELRRVGRDEQTRATLQRLPTEYVQVLTDEGDIAWWPTNHTTTTKTATTAAKTA